jgi:hypothetical protein
MPEHLVQFAAFIAAGYEIPIVEFLGDQISAGTGRLSGIKIVPCKRRKSPKRTLRVIVHNGTKRTIDSTRVIAKLIQSVNEGRLTLYALRPGKVAREPAELSHYLRSHRLQATFCGWTPGPEPFLIAIIDPNANGTLSTPDTFRVVAFVPVLNEIDVLELTLQYLIDQGIDVYVLDKWSTDGSYELTHDYLGRGVIGLERFPREGPMKVDTQVALLRRVEHMASTIPADWFVYHDADERRVSPWTGVTLRDGLFRVDQQKFNAIDHTVIEFLPAGCSGDDAHRIQRRDQFTFSAEPRHFVQRTAWKAQPAQIQLADSAGQDVTFPGRRVYPYKFLLRHYPICCQVERQYRRPAERVSLQDPFDASQSCSTSGHDVRLEATAIEPCDHLDRYDELRFNERYCVERLSGFGACDARWRTLGYPMLRFEQQAVTLRWSAASLRAEPKRPPSLDGMVPSPGSLVIHWETGNGFPGTIFVRNENQIEIEMPITWGISGSESMDGINPNVPHTFRLYTDPDRSALHAETTIRWRAWESLLE